MKRILVLILAVLMIAGLCGCGGKKTSGGADISGIKTLGDAFAANTGNDQAGWNDTKYIYVFEMDGVPIRVVAPMTKELDDQVNSVDFFADDRDEQIAEIIGGQEIERIDDLSKDIPPQKTLDELVGKSGTEVLNDGYEVWGHFYDDKDLEMTLVKGDYEYTVTFNEDVVPDDSFEPSEAIRDLTIKSITYSGISSNATNIEP